mgnify:CR=1 FL=1
MTIFTETVGTVLPMVPQFFLTVYLHSTVLLFIVMLAVFCAMPVLIIPLLCKIYEGVSQAVSKNKKEADNA